MRKDKILHPLTLLLSGALLLLTFNSAGQQTGRYADSVRKAFNVPAISYAVVSTDSVLEVATYGVIKKGSRQTTSLEHDRYRIGSNTKAVTGYIAALLVKQGKIKWDTRFFDLYPELKGSSRKEHYGLTLQQLLTFRTKLYPYTYTYDEPKVGQFPGDEQEQRYQFTKWFLQRPPVTRPDSICFSNLGYIAAGLMLEKVSGKSYKQLVTELGGQLGIDWGFGQPNANDPAQIWGHSATMEPEAPGNSQKLNWLLPAGNLNATMPDYLKFIQLQLRGLRGRSELLTKNEFAFLCHGPQQFAVGWFWRTDEHDHPYSYNIGNPGTFLTKVYLYDAADRAYIVFANAQTEGAETSTELLLDKLRAKYGR